MADMTREEWLEQVAKRPKPSNKVKQAEHIARDLAEGAINEYWESQLRVAPIVGKSMKFEGAIQQYFDALELYEEPLVKLLMSLRYVMQLDPRTYLLTEKAIQLLDKPRDIPMFISYKRNESSAFASLILARFQAHGLKPFLDLQDIVLGKNWKEALESGIKGSKVFMLCIGKTTLQSGWVRQEIQWAMDANIEIVPILHNGFAFDQNTAEKTEEELELEAKLKELQYVSVDKENPAEYDKAITQLLNQFGIVP